MTDPRFDPPCVERASTGDANDADDPRLDVFGPLGAEPVLQLELPRFPGGDVSDWTRPAASRIPGGLLVDIRPYDGAPTPISILVAVDADGSVRWQRCLDPAPSLVRVAERGDTEELLVGWARYGAAGLVEARYEVWSLASGRISRSWDEVLADNGITGPATGYRSIRYVNDSSVVVLTPSDTGAVAPTDSMLVVDLLDMTLRELPFPPGTVGQGIDAVQLEVTDDRRLMHLVPPGEVVARIAAVESGGGWSTRQSDLVAAAPVRVGYVYSRQPQALAGFDSQGVEIWRRDDVVAIPAEGFSVALDGDVVLAAACSDIPDFEGDWCPGQKLLALEASTGRTLWQRDGAWAVSVFGGGRALVSGPYSRDATTAPPVPVPWTMIDLTTGQTVGERSWTDPWRFSIGCCDEPQGAHRAGGVVVTVDEDTLELWYPEVLSTPLRRLSLG